MDPLSGGTVHFPDAFVNTCRHSIWLPGRPRGGGPGGRVTLPPRPPLHGRVRDRATGSPGRALTCAGVGAVDVRPEAVAHAGLGEQPVRTGWVGLELAPQLVHVEPEVAGGLGVSGTPDLTEQVLLAEQLAGMAEQHLEQVPLGRGQPDVGRVWPARFADNPLRGQVDDQVTEPDPRLVTVADGPPPDRAHAGEQFVHAERLGDVVVRARVKRLHLVRAV